MAYLSLKDYDSRLRSSSNFMFCPVYVGRSKPDAVRNSEHYLQALDEQLAICDQHEAFLDELNTLFPGSSSLT